MNHAASISRDIAVVGLGCRFPSAPSIQSFWDLLMAEHNAVGEIPRERWALEEYYDPRPGSPGKMNTKWGAFLENIEQFDAGFFRITPREAKSMDPQQRLLLEVAWEALEHAGIPHEQLERSLTGVFVGICSSEYSMLTANGGDYKSFDKYFGTGTALSVAAGRIAYFLNLRGPALSIDTACSSSLVALHQAVNSLRLGESDLCLAAGVNIVLSPAVGIYFSQLGAVSGSACCKAFDAAADGYVRGEGCGVVVLKRLSDAQRDGDRIHAVIKGSAINHDGRSAGLSAPNGQAQEAVLRAALRDGEVNPKDVIYIEAHGTGTRLGDPIEAAAIGKVYGGQSRNDGPLLIGSVKTNLGHLEAAAGIAGFIKAVLSLQQRKIPASLHLRVPNPLIAWDENGLKVAAQATAMSPLEHSPKVAVSSFGFSGTNAHIVLSALDAQQPHGGASTLECFFLPISARSRESMRALLRAAAEQFEAISADDHESVSAACRGWARRRSHHDIRECVVGVDSKSLATALRERLALHEDGQINTRHAPVSSRVAFVFSGQGSQWLGMGAELLRNATSRAALEEVDAIVRRIAGWSVLEELAPQTIVSTGSIDRTQVSLFALQVALARLWRSLGVHPYAVVGHSMGEIAAAHVAGILDLEQATMLSIIRSQLLAQVAGQGAMAVAAVPHARASAIIAQWGDRISIAGTNSLDSVTFSGERDAIKELVLQLNTENVFCRELRTDGVAGHSKMVAPLAPLLVERMNGLAPRQGNALFVSCVTGGPRDGQNLDSNYWAQNLVAPVRFADCVEHLAQADCRSFIEISAKPMLVPSIKQVCEARGATHCAIGTLHPDRPLVESLTAGVAQLYRCGAQINWSTTYPGNAAWTPTPSYAWQRERHWISEISYSVDERTSRLAERPSDEALLREVLNRWDCEGVGSYNMPNLAPLTLLTPNNEAAFFLSVRGRSCIVWAFIGPSQEFRNAAEWLQRQCESARLKMVLVAGEEIREVLSSLGFEHSPFGSIHRIRELTSFSLEGRAMRRLRAQVLRYQRVGNSETFEHSPGVDTALDRAIITLIDEWIVLKKRRVPAAERLQHSILAGKSLAPHRLFLTRSGDALHSALLLTPFSNGKGYLLDLEFYGPQTPSGCTEAGIVTLIETLRSERCSELSLGGSYCLSGPEKNSPLFAAYEQQLRFKRKFRAHESQLFLYCHEDAKAQGLSDILGTLISDAPAAPAKVLRQLDTASLAIEESPLHKGPRRLRVAGNASIFEWNLPADNQIVREHRVHDVPVLPGAAYIDLILKCLRELDASQSWSLSSLAYVESLRFEADASQHIQLVFTPESSDRYAVEVFFWKVNSWAICARTTARQTAAPVPALDQADDTDWIEVPARDLYASLARAGIQYGAGYRRIKSIRRQNMQIRARIDGCADAESHCTDTLTFVLDSALQAMAAGSAAQHGGQIVLQSIESVHIFDSPKRLCTVAIRMTSATSDALLHSGDLDIFNDKGIRVASLRGVFARILPPRKEGREEERTERPPSTGELIYSIDWRAASLPAPRYLSTETLILGPDRPLMNQLQDELQSAGLQVSSICAADRPAAIAALANASAIEWAQVGQIILLPAQLSATSPLLQGAAAHTELARLLSDRLHGAPVSIWAVTQSVRTVDVHNPLVDDAALWGSHAVLESEHSEWSCGLIDIAADLDTLQASRAIHCIVSNAGAEKHWAVTAEGPRIARLLNRSPADAGAWSIKPDAAYVITGWTGGLGVYLAEWLLRRGAKHLILAARSDGNTLTNSELDACARAHSALLTRVRLDVRDEAAVFGLFERINKDGLVIKGVFHAADELADRLLVRQTPDEFVAAAAAKVTGAWNLHRATSSLELDAFVLFSSAAAIFAPPSQAGHAAACAAVDYLASLRSAMGLPALSVGWGLWARIGKAAGLATFEALQQHGMRAMTPDRAMAAFDRLRTIGASGQAIVMQVDWQRWNRSSASSAALFAEVRKGSASAAQAPAHRERLPGNRLAGSVEEQILTTIAATLMMKVEDIDTARSLEANGFDSIMTVELRERLNRTLGVAPPLIDFFREPTIASLSLSAVALLQR